MAVESFSEKFTDECEGLCLAICEYTGVTGALIAEYCAKIPDTSSKYFCNNPEYTGLHFFTRVAKTLAHTVIDPILLLGLTAVNALLFGTYCLKICYSLVFDDMDQVKEDLCNAANFLFTGIIACIGALISPILNLLELAVSAADTALSM